MKPPNLFIIGAPKCGTSSLARTLADHPDVYLPFVKEPNHFGSDIPSAVKDYSSLYARGDGHRIRIDASTLYLSSKDAIAEIAEACPDARFIALFRDPVEAVPAFHAQLLRHDAEQLVDFERAWAAHEDRKAGRVEGPVYANYFAYGSQVARALRAAPDGHLRCYPFRCLIDAPDDVLAEIQAFLEIDFLDLKLRHENAHRDVRFLTINSLKLRFARLAKRIKLIVGVDRDFGLGARLFAFGYRSTARTPISEGTRRDIRRTFEDELAELERLTGIRP